VRTVHHVDDFRDPVLADCQTASIVDVDHRICVSRHWAEAVRRDFGMPAEVIPNGVDAARFAAVGEVARADARARLGLPERPVVLAVGGIEPRKGSRTLLAAAAALRRAGPAPLVVVAGGETLFDYADYRAAWEADAERLGMRVHRGPRPSADADVAVLGTVADGDLPLLYRAADALAFPSEREGFGLVVLEAMAAGTPAVVSDLPVLREHLADGRDCLMAPPGDADALAAALARVLHDGALAARLVTEGRHTAARHTWAAAAEAHERVYGRVVGRA
jgi:glycosyltransferase-like protein